MKEHIIYKILYHLYERDAINEDAVDVTDFLKQIWNESDKVEEFNNLNRIKYAMNRISEDGYGSFSKDPGHHDLNENKAAGGKVYRCTLNNTAVKARITTRGYDYIVEELRKRKQDELLENTIATNISLQAANGSTADLNFQTKKYYRQLEIATWVIAIATVLNIAATVIPVVLKSNDSKSARFVQPAQEAKGAAAIPAPNNSRKPSGK